MKLWFRQFILSIAFIPALALGHPHLNSYDSLLHDFARGGMPDLETLVHVRWRIGRCIKSVSPSVVHPSVLRTVEEQNGPYYENYFVANLFMATGLGTTPDQLDHHHSRELDEHYRHYVHSTPLTVDGGSLVADLGERYSKAYLRIYKGTVMATLKYRNKVTGVCYYFKSAE